MSKKAFKVDKASVTIVASGWIAVAVVGTIVLKNNWQFLYLFGVYGFLLLALFILKLLRNTRLTATLFYSLLWSVVVGGLALFLLLQWFNAGWSRGFV